MQDLIREITKEINWFLNAEDKREYVIERCLELFDEYFVPIDLPGPDQIIDPLLRAAIRPLIGRIYDEILKKLSEQK